MFSSCKSNFRDRCIIWFHKAMTRRRTGYSSKWLPNPCFDIHEVLNRKCIVSACIKMVLTKVDHSFHDVKCEPEKLHSIFAEAFFIDVSISNN